MGFTSEYFKFANIKSSDMGLYVIRLDSGFFSTEISGEKSIISEKIPYRDIPYTYRTELSPLKFSIIVSPLEGLWTDDFKYNVFGWLNTRIPQEFRTGDFVGKLCYCICTNAFELYTAGLNQGYITLNFEATTSNWLSDIQISRPLDCTNATPSSPITFEIDAKFNVANSYGDYHYYPKLLIDMQGSATSITLRSNSDSGRTFGFTGLTAKESLEIDNDLKQIKSNTNNYRLGNRINNNWFRLVKGRNIISVNNSSIIQIQAIYPIYI